MSKLPLTGGGPSGAADPYAAYLIYDEFTDTNATAIGDHTPDKDIEAGGWTATRGTGFTIQSNSLDCNGAADQITEIDSGVAAVKSIVGTLIAGGYAGAIARDDGTATLAGWLGSSVPGDNKLIIFEMNGAYVERASYSQVHTPGDSFTNFELRCTGDTITLHDNGTQRVTYSSSTFNTQTYCGVFGYGEDGTANYDNYSVIAI